MSGVSDSTSRCFICRRRAADSREHLPAKAAGNFGPVEVFYLDSRLASNPAAGYRSSIFDDGFWVRRFCEPCNNLLGRRYVPAYAELVKATEGASGIRDARGRLFISLPAAYPALIIKQMFAMFLAALPKMPDPAWKLLQDFVRLRDSTLPSLGRQSSICTTIALHTDESSLPSASSNSHHTRGYTFLKYPGHLLGWSSAFKSQSASSRWKRSPPGARSASVNSAHFSFPCQAWRSRRHSPWCTVIALQQSASATDAVMRIWFKFQIGHVGRSTSPLSYGGYDHR